MKGKKKCFLIIILVAIIFSSIFHALNRRTVLSIKVGDSLEDVELIDINGQKTSINDIQNKKVIVFYLARGCHPCIQEYPSIILLCEALENTDWNPIIVWRKSIPTELVEEKDKRFHFSLVSAEFSDYSPCFYFIEDNSVTFQTQSLEKVIKKALMETSQDEVRKNVLLHYVNERKVKDTLFWFLFLSDNYEMSSSKIPEDGETIYFSDIAMSNSIYDPERVISQIFSITQYPTILKCNTETLEYEISE